MRSTPPGTRTRPRTARTASSTTRSSGKLRYDKDGKGGHKAKLFAILDDGPNDLSHHDFLIVA